MITVLGINNKIEAEDAVEIMNCSMEFLINLINKKKISAQKINNKWYLSPTDCYQYKELIQREKSEKRSLNVINQSLNLSKAHVVSSVISNNEIEIKIKIPKIKYQIINSALKETRKTNLYQVLNQKIDEAYEKLANIDLN